MLWKVLRPSMELEKIDDEDEIILREAFGDSRFLPSRKRALEIIDDLSKNQQWIKCDCHTGLDQLPYLIPVSRYGLRRLDQYPHDPKTCEFKREHDDPSEVRSSLRRPPAVAPGALTRVSLASAFGDDDQEISLVSERQSTSLARRQPRLARLLRELLYRANDHILNQDDILKSKELAAEQQNRIVRQASSVRIASHQRLSEWLAFGKPGLDDLISRLKYQNPRDWVGARPHGVVIFSASAVVGQEIRYGKEGRLSVAVRGQVSVFGERDGVNRHSYVVIGLVARRTSNEAPDLLRAYAHPCLNYSKWALVDSNLERVTFRLINDIRSALRGRHEYDIIVEKPLFDITPANSPEHMPVIIPDFMVHRTGGGRPAATIFVETMGYNDDRYRYRKKILTEFLEKAKAPNIVTSVVPHDRFGHVNSDDGDNDFVERLTAKLLG